MVKIKSSTKYIVAGVALIGVFVFFTTKLAGAFQPSARGQNKIRMFRGRSNYYGTRLGNRTTFTHLAGNKSQRRLQRQGTRLMRRG